MTNIKKILVLCGDPSGVGPDLCIDLAYKSFPAQITVIGSSKVILERAKILKKKI
jgi:4-hydroxythreonine-4-phosphate dehydrogenase